MYLKVCIEENIPIIMMENFSKTDKDNSLTKDIVLTILGMFGGGEAAVGGHVEEQGTAQRQFLGAAGEEYQQLANRRFVQ